MAWSEGTRAEPTSARTADTGRFEVKHRDGRARLGVLHTAHGAVQTPTLLPVINPNIRTIEPREMWDKYGVQMLITNSYIIWKHAGLREKAVNEGVHALLDFPGAIMTDSGTFQSYVYGEVDVGPEEIVAFQRSIGVDVATMLDVFSRPEMTEEELADAVDETLARAGPSVEAAAGTMLNGPIQGGDVHALRRRSAEGMGEHGFAIHPLGGIVPVMEQQRYADLARVVMGSVPHLPPDRPVHMFGCGHPMLFPMLIALGADLFDSAAYALFARDGRLLTPTGTVHLERLQEWPLLVPCVVGHTPDEVRRMEDEARESVLARFNLEVTLGELAACRQAVHEGRIWERAERRSHAHPALREAFLWLTTSPARGSAPIPGADHLLVSDRDAARDTTVARGAWEEAWDWIVDAQETPGTGAILWAGEDTFVRPQVVAARRRLHAAWRPASDDGPVLIVHGASAPWRDRVGRQVERARAAHPRLEVLVLSPLGLVPWALEDLQPFAHVEGPKWLWVRPLDPAWVRRELERLHLHDRPFAGLNLQHGEVGEAMDEALADLGLGPRAPNDSEAVGQAATAILAEQARSKAMLELLLDRATAESFVDAPSFVMSSTGRIRNVFDAHGRHILSPRLNDGGLSLTDEGARRLHALIADGGQGPPVVTVPEDAVPFVGAGRNVIHGFLTSVEGELVPGRTCLIVDPNGDLVAHGVARCTTREALDFRKGVAIRVRGGLRAA
jgi:7-cyano-7-deazaguanine tRNA-ribosyltransferase